MVGSGHSIGTCKPSYSAVRSDVLPVRPLKVLPAGWCARATAASIEEAAGGDYCEEPQNPRAIPHPRIPEKVNTWIEPWGHDHSPITEW